jgi:hypothetical protein
MISKYLIKIDNSREYTIEKTNTINKTGCFGVEVYFQI